MAIAEPLESSQLEARAHIHKLAPAGSAFRQTEGDDGELSTENLGNLLRRVSKTSMDEIDNLIGELQTLRRKLQSDGDRIQRDIAEYAELSQQVMQLTTIISDSVKKLPGPSGISR
jgi:chemotaxis protein histidine kinase CheA